MRQPTPLHQTARSTASSVGRSVAPAKARSRRRRSVRERLFLVLVEVLVALFAGWYLVNVTLPGILKSSLPRPVASAQTPTPTKR